MVPIDQGADLNTQSGERCDYIVRMYRSILLLSFSHVIIYCYCDQTVIDCGDFFFLCSLFEQLSVI